MTTTVLIIIIAELQDSILTTLEVAKSTSK